jgi:hypothetical protein
MATTLADTIDSITPFLAPVAAAAISVSRSSPDTAAKVTAAMQGVTTGIQALAASDTAAQSQPIVNRIETDALVVITAVPVGALPFPYSILATIAQGMLPTLISSVNLLLQHKVSVTALPAPVPAAA